MTKIKYFEKSFHISKLGIILGVESKTPQYESETKHHLSA